MTDECELRLLFLFEGLMKINNINKFKLKITQKSKNITKKYVFEQKRVICRPSKTDQKSENCLFSQNYFFAHFNHF